MFKVGDIIVSKTQKKYPKPIQLTIVPRDYYDTYYGTYLDTGNEKSIAYYQISNYKLYEETEEVMNTKTLYSFVDEKGQELFGTHVGTNSQNKYILEVKGYDTYFIKDPKELEEVLPYTFSVNIGGKEVHYQGKPDKISKGDYLMIATGNSVPCIGVVSAVDTKNKAARAKFTGVKLVTEKI
jgi:hypothetical protein